VCFVVLRKEPGLAFCVSKHRREGDPRHLLSLELYSTFHEFQFSLLLNQANTKYRIHNDY
jgi:hypothetical protein